MTADKIRNCLTPAQQFRLSEVPLGFAIDAVEEFLREIAAQMAEKNRLLRESIELQKSALELQRESNELQKRALQPYLSLAEENFGMDERTQNPKSVDNGNVTQKELTTPLHLSGNATDHIWLMEDGPESHPIGVRLDCGDSGTVYFSRKQARDLAEELTSFAANEPDTDKTKGETK